MLTATLLGCGGTQPLPDRALSALAVSYGGSFLLMDCGEGTQTACRAHGVSIYRISAVLLTHYHGDHIFGLPGLLQTMAALNRTSPLVIAGPPGLVEILESVTRLTGPLPFRLLPCEPPFTLDGLCVESFPLEHRVPCVGYAVTLPRPGKFDPARAKAAGIPVACWSRLQAGETVEGYTPSMVLGPPRRGLKVIYATDTRPCESLLHAAQNADLLCMDSTYASDADLKKAQLYGHSTCRETGELAAAAHVRRLWLTHYSGAVTDTEESLAAARAACPAAQAGYDGLREELVFDKE